MQEQLLDVICDTSFLINLANLQIKNINNLETEIGSINFIVPTIVLRELEGLLKNEKKKTQIENTMNYIKRFKLLEIHGDDADNAIIEYLKNNQGIAATLDVELKKRIKKLGRSVLSLSNNKVVLEE